MDTATEGEFVLMLETGEAASDILVISGVMDKRREGESVTLVDSGWPTTESTRVIFGVQE